MTFTIAIDGPAASGKGTVSRRVAEAMGFGYLDTGRLYRAVGKRMLEGEDPEAAARTLDPDGLDDPELRLPEVAEAASKVAAIGAVRAALVDFQRAYAARSGGAVLDGRDIGTVICPDAPVKLFVTASAEVRADRRLRQLLEAGHRTDFDTVLDDIRVRDARDMGRSDAPLRPADDATVLDTSRLGVEEAVSEALRLVNAGRPDG